MEMYALVRPDGTIVKESVAPTKSQAAQKATRIHDGRFCTVETVEVRLKRCETAEKLNFPIRETIAEEVIVSEHEQPSDFSQPDYSVNTIPSPEPKKGFWAKLTGN